MWKALKVEIKNSITKTPFHLIRFFGLFMIPLIYGFSYIFAFYDPFTKVNQVDAAIVTHKTDEHGNRDYLGDAMGRILSKEQEVQMGEINMTMKMHHIYAEDQNVNKVIDDNYATMTIPSLNNIDDKLARFIDAQASGTLIKAMAAVNEIKAAVDTINTGGFKMHLNDKKNYLLAFGIKASPFQASTYSTLAGVLVQALNDPAYKAHIVSKLTNGTPAEKAAKWTSFMSAINNIGLENFIKHDSIVAMESYMGGEKAKYGYGLAPFFISVAMWIGGMVMTFAIHRKIYDKSIMPGVRYFAKWILIVSGTTMQATLLMLSLYFLGFKHLGDNHWMFMYGTAVLAGIVFGSIIQALRFSIHNRNLGILITIILLVLQMASAGGLFPIETQTGFYRAINNVVPMGKTVNMLREASFETNWTSFLTNMGYLFIWLLLVPLGIWINWRRTIKIYLDQGFTMPPKMFRLYQKKMARNKLKAERRGVA